MDFKWKYFSNSIFFCSVFAAVDGPTVRNVFYSTSQILGLQQIYELLI